MNLTNRFRNGLILTVAVCTAFGAGCSAGSGTATNQKTAVAQSTPLAEAVEPRFTEAAKLLDRQCVISNKEQWDAKFSSTLADVRSKTGKNVSEEELYVEAAQIAPLFAEDAEVKKNADGKYDCTYLLPRAAERLTERLAPKKGEKGKG